MKRSIILLGLLCSFSLCYMEWGGGQSSTIAALQWKILFKDHNLVSVLTHPLILSGLLGQIILLWSALAPRVPRWLTFTGIVLLLAVVLLVLLAGALSANARMIFSTLPFVILAAVHFYAERRKKKSSGVTPS